MCSSSSIVDVRHACDQGDGIQGYGYHKHDGREYASQEINDKPSNIKLNTEFIKVPGGKHGGDWGVRISGTTMDDFGNRRYVEYQNAWLLTCGFFFL